MKILEHNQKVKKFILDNGTIISGEKIKLNQIIYTSKGKKFKLSVFDTFKYKTLWKIKNLADRINTRILFKYSERSDEE